MEFIQLSKECPNISYPVGGDLTGLLKSVEYMSQGIKTAFKYEDDKELCLLATGSSGAIIAGLIASKLGGAFSRVKICHLKKQGEKSHSSGIRPSSQSLKVIVDDFISSGETVNRIANGFDLPHVNAICVTEEIYKDRIKFSFDYAICHSYFES